MGLIFAGGGGVGVTVLGIASDEELRIGGLRR